MTSGRIRARPQDDRGRHPDPGPHPRGLRGGGAGKRPARRAALLTFVIVGAGPTGVELAGTIADLARDTLPPDFRAIDTRMTNVLLVEAGPRVLPGYPRRLSDYARGALEKLGVEVALGEAVTEIERRPRHVRRPQRPGGNDHLGRGRPRLARRRMAGGGGRPRRPDHRRARPQRARPSRHLRDRRYRDGRRRPTAGRCRASRPPPSRAAGMSRGSSAPASPARTAPGPFLYRHDGSLAQIGKRKAVIDFGWIRLRGAMAWWLWGIAHIYFLVGVHSRLSVALNWLWIHARNQRSARLITGDSESARRMTPNSNRSGQAPPAARRRRESRGCRRPGWCRPTAASRRAAG